jgi:hypothetical protein
VRDRRWALAGLVVAATLMTGCSEKQQANETLPSPSAAETSESLPQVGPADFPVPDEARTKDAAGAEAFLRYWIDLLNHQRQVLEGQPLRDLGPECRDCVRIANNLDEVKAAGHRYAGGELSLNDVTQPQLTEGTASINFGLRQEAVRLVDATGSPVDEGLAIQANLSSGVTLAWSARDKSWLVVSMTFG